jgi:DNA-binding NarL/FixJ family response regulator
MRVVAEAGEVGELLRLAGELRPNVAVLDIAMPGGGGLKALEPLRKVAPQCRVLILTMHTDRSLVLSSIAAGASGYLVKSSDFAELRDAIRRVHKGKTYFSVPVGPEGDAGPLPAVASAEAPRLSPREREVVRLLALGFTYREMAAQLGISERSVETYRARVAQKLGLEGRAAVVRYALSSGLLDGEAL